MSRMRNGLSGSLMFVNRLWSLVSELWLISRAFSARQAEPLTKSKNLTSIINSYDPLESKFSKVNSANQGSAGVC